MTVSVVRKSLRINKIVFKSSTQWLVDIPYSLMRIVVVTMIENSYTGMVM